MDIDTAELRKFLVERLSDQEFNAFCFDYFRDAYHDFADTMTRGQKVQELLAYCERHGKKSDLLLALQREYPNRFRQWFHTNPEILSLPTSFTRNPRQIFISHAHQDADFAHRLAYDLEQKGWDIWIAPDSIRPGEKWGEAIDRGLEESGLFALVITEAAIHSRWVRDETYVAIEMEKKGEMRFIPLLLQPARLPGSWRVYQYISFVTQYETSLEMLLAELSGRHHSVQPSLPKQPESVAQKVLNILRSVPTVAWGGIGVVLVVVLLWIWLGDGENNFEPTRVVQPTEASTQMIAVAGTGTSTPTRRPTLTPSIAATTPTATDEPEATTTLTAEPSDTPQPPTPTHTLPPPTATTNPNIPPANASLHDTWTRPADGMTMVFVPGGTFMMGSNPDVDLDAQSNEQPQHEVTLDGFWLDQTEVTNGQFRRFIAATSNGAISVPENNDRENYPVGAVSWGDAVAYCEWAGGQLPTEAQWEYAARGPEGYTYPWGNDLPNSCLQARFGGCSGIAEVGTTVEGTSWVEAFDMAGNVWEWVADWYGDYQNTSVSNPTGPDLGDDKVLRGSSYTFFSPRLTLRSARRQHYAPWAQGVDLGFRCVMISGN